MVVIYIRAGPMPVNRVIYPRRHCQKPPVHDLFPHCFHMNLALHDEERPASSDDSGVQCSIAEYEEKLSTARWPASFATQNSVSPAWKNIKSEVQAYRVHGRHRQPPRFNLLVNGANASLLAVPATTLIILAHQSPFRDSINNVHIGFICSILTSDSLHRQVCHT